MPALPREITQLLLAWRNGDSSALDKLMPLVYEELRGLAKHYMAAERPGHTLQTTALINEAYLRLIDHKEMRWQNRAHFFGVAAQAMRRVLVDHARTRDAAKRGGGTPKASLEDAAVIPERSVDLIALDEALNDLATLDPRKSRMVELRYFGGLSVEETAEVLGVSPVTVMRDWSAAKAWLLRAISRRQAG
jgi:RNA polymerase sigma factor (TIGR02999 family)